MLVAFATAFTLRTVISRRPIMQEVRYHPFMRVGRRPTRARTLTAHRTASSDSISIVNYFLYHSFPRGTLRYLY